MKHHANPRGRVIGRGAVIGLGLLLLGAMGADVTAQEVAATAVAAPAASAPAAGEGSDLLRTDSRAPYLHRITLYDETGAAIAPGDEPAKPYSPSRTCGKCHPYGEIGHGWHFNAVDPKVDAGRPGEPWILADPHTGTQLPLSYRGWPGTWKPRQIGLTDWEFVQNFGRQLPGGGPGEHHEGDMAKPAADLATSTPAAPAANELPEPDDPNSADPLLDDAPVNPDAPPPVAKPTKTNPQEQGPAPVKPRWGAAGNLEIDCLVCHSADRVHDQTDWARQIKSQNFRYIHTSIVGLGAVGGSAKDLPDEFKPDESASHSNNGPRLTWDKTKFGPDERVVLNIQRTPNAEQCYTCHSTRLVGQGVPPAWPRTKDVHLAGGLTCASCHGNGVDHQTVRGTEGPAGHATTADEFSCRGCHLGHPGKDGKPGPHGTFGAPYPKHKGLPPLHLEELSCTACHAGPRPGASAQFVQTSMAHGLGVAEQGRRTDALPFIEEPVLMKGADGRIAPHRLVWPAFWGRLKDGKVTPLAPDAVLRAAPAVLGNPGAKDKAKEAKPLAADQVTSILLALAADKTAGEPVYVASGQLQRLGTDGKTITEDNPAAKPYAWPMAHDVRPAAQALGANGCTDCHSPKSTFFFGQIAASGPIKVQHAPVLRMGALQDLDSTWAQLWGYSFWLRPSFKIIALLASALVGGVLCFYGLAGLGRITRLFRGRL